MNSSHANSDGMSKRLPTSQLPAGPGGRCFRARFCLRIDIVRKAIDSPKAAVRTRDAMRVDSSERFPGVNMLLILYTPMTDCAYIRAAREVRIKPRHGEIWSDLAMSRPTIDSEQSLSTHCKTRSVSMTFQRFRTEPSNRKAKRNRHPAAC